MNSLANCYVFDLDGVLADTEALVREAYRCAGVNPQDIEWGRPWHEWVPLVSEFPSRTHNRKITHYARLLREVHLEHTSAWHAAHFAHEAGVHVWLATGASEEAVISVADNLGWLPPIGVYGATLEARLNFLRRKARDYDTGVYVDDVTVSVPSDKWRFVKYTFDTPAEEILWTP